MSFPDFTRHFFFLLAETIDSVSTAILIHLTQPGKPCCFCWHIDSFCWTRRARAVLFGKTGCPSMGHSVLWSGLLAYAFTLTVCSAWQRYGVLFIIRILLCRICLFPHLFLLSLLHVSHGRCFVANTHMGTAVVVELYEPWNEVACIFKCGQQPLWIDTFHL